MNDAKMKVTVTEKQKRSVECPFCGRAKGRPCRSSRIPGPNSFGGGWGGPPDLAKAHSARRDAYLADPTDKFRLGVNFAAHRYAYPGTIVMSDARLMASSRDVRTFTPAEQAAYLCGVASVIIGEGC